MKYRRILEEKEQRRRIKERNHKWWNELAVAFWGKSGASKRSVLTLLWQVLKDCVRVATAALIFLLAFVGLISLTYTGPRRELLVILERLWEEVARNFAVSG